MGAISCAVRTPYTANISTGEWLFEVFVPSLVKVSILEISFVSILSSNSTVIRMLRARSGVAATYAPFISDEGATTDLGGIVSVWAQRPVIPPSWVADVRRASLPGVIGMCWTFPRGLVLTYGLSLAALTGTQSLVGLDLSISGEV